MSIGAHGAASRLVRSAFKRKRTNVSFRQVSTLGEQRTSPPPPKTEKWVIVEIVSKAKQQNYKIAASFLRVGRSERGSGGGGGRLSLSAADRHGKRAAQKASHTHQLSMTTGGGAFTADPSCITCNSSPTAACAVLALTHMHFPSTVNA